MTGWTHEVLERAADALGMHAGKVAAVRLFGAVAGVAYQPDEVEIERRATVGLGAITNMAVLDALMGLPGGMRVAISDLTDRERRLLRRAPAGAVGWDEEHVERRAVPPVTPRLAVVRARDWQTGMTKAGQFAPFCARVMLLSKPPADLDDAAVQASFWGIGMCVATGGTVRTLVEPEPYVRVRHSPAQWRFAEEIYRQVSMMDAGRDAA